MEVTIVKVGDSGIESPPPLEQVDPELGELLMLYCQGRADKIIPSYEVLRKRVLSIGRNDPCPWCLEKGINIKYKKCVLHFKN